MKFNQKLALVFILFLFLFIQVGEAHAQYVLPYPSYMPGNKLYSVSRVVDIVKKWWYWGGIASCKYHRELSDKYIVEAKTLFEYKQYFFAVRALKRSDDEFQKLPLCVQIVKKEGVDAGDIKKTIREETVAHEEVLSLLITEVPVQFMWSPEKVAPTLLPLQNLLNNSKIVRENVEKYME